MMIVSAEIEPCELDEDDDFLVLVFDDDPAARKLELPETGAGQE